jgi:hypothetical protein
VARADATPEPETAAPAGEPVEETGFIARERVNLRPCPDEATCPAVAALRMNEEVRVLGQQDGWLHVRVPRLAREGYVARRLVLPRPTATPAPATIREERASPPVAGGKKAREGGRSVGAGGPTRLPEEELLQ